MSSSASAVRKKDGSVLDFYCTKSLYGGTLASLGQIWIHCVSKRLDSESLTSQYGFATYADCSVSAGDALCLIQMELQNEEHKTRVAENSIQSRMLIEKSGRNPTENQRDEAFISQDPTG